ncbi:hypothetical protein BD414DRAFT_411494, partial [Trametes punicea]
ICFKALLAYEYLLALDQEIRLIWMRKKTAATLLFLLIRYWALITMVFLQAISAMPMSDNVRVSPRVICRCSRYVKVQAGLQYAQYFTWATFSGLRALALSGMNWPLSLVVFVLACAPFAVNMWQLGAIGVVGSNIPLVGCIGGSNITLSEAKIATAVSRSGTIAADILLVAISWRYAAQDWTFRDARTPTMSLTRVMVLNGHALSILNALHLTLTLLSLVGVADDISPVTIFTDPLTAILICRFLLDLHSANVKTTGQDTDEWHLRLDAGTLQFASIIDSMAGAVSSGPESNTLFEEDSTAHADHDREITHA